MIIIGITGTLGAGKGTIVDYLVQKKGFSHFSVRAFITGEINQRGLPVNRDSMVLVANDLRAKHYPGYIVEQLYNHAAVTGDNCVIESLRAPGEVELLQKKPGFSLLAIDADPATRYERIVIRSNETDHITFEEFLANEQREMNSIDPNRQNISKCIEMADYKLFNNGTIEELNQEVEELLKKIIKKNYMEENKQNRPSWDEYFLEISRTVATRATCDRGRSGCVIARDKQILVTGYVGAPTGLPHCDDAGHQMKKIVHEDGKVTQHCVRTVHAEQNAITQAAKLGISINNSTLYCKMTPCRTCAMMIINCGIKRVVCEKKYHAGDESEEMFRQAGVEIAFVDADVEKYDNQ